MMLRDWDEWTDRVELARVLQAKLDGPRVAVPAGASGAIQLCVGASLFHADCREALRGLPDNSIDSCVTDPPYALVSIVKRFGGANAAPAKGNEAYMRASAGFMGKTWDNGETAFSHEFWAEVLRVLKPGGHVAAFGASRGYHRMACAIEDAGFEIRDSLMWVYGTGFPKSHDVAKGIDKAAGHWRGRAGEVIDRTVGQVAKGTEYARTEKGDPITAAAAAWEGWGTALKPAFEPIVLARKPLSEGTVAANVLKWGTGALNIGACRVGTEGGGTNCNNRDENGKCLGHKNAGRSTSGETFHGPESNGAAGRWPANVVHDGSDEVVGAFPASKGQQGDVRGDEPSECHSGVYSGPRNRQAFTKRSDPGGSAARFFYSAKASKADRAGSKHPTVKPVALMQWLCRLITPPGGTVLDPFAGSGTTGAAAVAEGFRAVLCEREDEYVQDIRNRMDPHHTPHTHTPGRRIYGVFADEKSARSARSD